MPVNEKNNNSIKSVIPEDKGTAVVDQEMITINCLKTVIKLEKKCAGLEAIAAEANRIFKEDNHLRRIKIKVKNGGMFYSEHDYCSMSTRDKLN